MTTVDVDGRRSLKVVRKEKKREGTSFEGAV
jgi:hypothetical protein